MNIPKSNMTDGRVDNGRFFVRVGIVAAAVVLVMYLGKIWFFDQGRTGVPPAGAASQVISWQDAGKHCGEYAVVEGTIVLSHNSGKACFLNFHLQYKDHFTAVIFASAFLRFPANPEVCYLNKKVRVSGIIKEFDGKPEIVLEDPSQIEIVR
jgi:hypothetical protein